MNGTRFQIALIPFGGYVALPRMGDTEMVDEVWDPPPADVAEKIPSFLEKIWILAAGAGFNLLFALSIACVLWAVGIPIPKSDCTTTIGAIPQTIAHLAGDVPNPLTSSGLAIGDQILSVDGIELQNFSQLPKLIAIGARHTNDGQPVADLQIRRGDDVLHLEIPVFQSAEKENRLRHAAVFPACDLRVKTVLENSPAQRVGLRPGDQILAIDGRKLLSPVALDEYLQNAEGLANLAVCRDGKILQISIQSQPLIIQKAYMRGGRKGRTVIFVEGEKSKWLALNGPKNVKNRQFSNNELTAKFTSLEYIPAVIHKVFGVTFENPQVLTHPNPIKLLFADILAVWHMLCSLLNCHSDVGVQDLTGVFGMGRLLHHLIQNDLRLALAFVVSFNAGLAFLNLLPIPGLDGGFIFFALVEKAIRRPFPKWFANFAQRLCLFLLFILLVYVCFSDVLRWRCAINRRLFTALCPPSEFNGIICAAP
jgi:regulator of sigma E protease